MIYQNKIFHSFFEQSSNLFLDKETWPKFKNIQTNYLLVKEIKLEQNEAIDPFLTNSFLKQIKKLKEEIRNTNLHSTSVIDNEKGLLTFILEAGKNLKRHVNY